MVLKDLNINLQNVKDRLRFNLIYSLASFSLTFPLRSRVHSLRLFSDSSAILNCYTCCSYPFSTVGRHFRRYWVLLLLFWVDSVFSTRSLCIFFPLLIRYTHSLFAFVFQICMILLQVICSCCWIIASDLYLSADFYY